MSKLLINDIKIGITETSFCPMGEGIVYAVNFTKNSKTKWIYNVHFEGIPNFFMSEEDLYDLFIKNEDFDFRKYELKSYDSIYLDGSEYEDLYNGLRETSNDEALLIKFMVYLAINNYEKVDDDLAEIKGKYLEETELFDELETFEDFYDSLDDFNDDFEDNDSIDLTDKVKYLSKEELYQEVLMVDNYLFGNTCVDISFNELNNIINKDKEISNILIFAFENDIKTYEELKKHFSTILLNLNKQLLQDKGYIRKVNNEDKVFVSNKVYVKIKYISKVLSDLEEQYELLLSREPETYYDFKNILDKNTNLEYGLFGDGKFKVVNTEDLLNDTINVLSCINGEKLTELYRMQLNCKNDINIVLEEGIEVIDSEIFILCKNEEFIKRIFIPKTVNKIKVGCFLGYNIDNIVIDKDNQTYHCKDNCIIETATNALIAVGNNFIIPDYVNKIEDKAFAYNNKICNEKLPKSINTIGKEAFRGCDNLRELIIPSDCKIGKDAFLGCHNLLIKYN